MSAQLQSSWGRMTTAVAKLSLAQKVFAVLATVALVILGTAVIGWVGKPTLTPLFSGVSGTDAAAIADYLKSKDVTYELADGGTTIMVPVDDVYAQRIALAAEGLPSDTDGAGYSLLDNLSATSTEFQEQTTYQRAMEGELARTIEALSGVKTASVKLAIPEESVFTDAQQAPTASVFIEESAGSALSAGQVQAIVHLVSAGIPGMSSSDVAVVNAAGTVLSSVGSAGGTAMADQQTGDYESRLEAAVHELLDPLVGAANVTVTATAELNYDTTRTTTESYQGDPNTPPLQSSTTTEQYTGAGSDGATGVLGPDNIAVPSGTDTSGDGTYSSTSEDVVNAVDKTTEEVIAAPGTVERQAVSVVINSETGNALDMVVLETSIAAAVGLNTPRGDTLSVQRMPFDTTVAAAAEEALAAAEEEQSAAAKWDLITKGGIAALVLIALIMIIAFGARRSRQAKREALDLGRLEASTAEREQAALEYIGSAGNLAEISAPDPDEPDPVAEKRQQVAALADEQPEEVADLLRGWLTEIRR